MGLLIPMMIFRVGVWVWGMCGMLTFIIFSFGRGLRAFATIYAGWGVGGEWYTHKRYETAGFTSAREFVERSYVEGFSACDANDLLAQVSLKTPLDHPSPPVPSSPQPF